MGGGRRTRGWECDSGRRGWAGMTTAELHDTIISRLTELNDAASELENLGYDDVSTQEKFAAVACTLEATTDALRVIGQAVATLVLAVDADGGR